MLFYNFTLFIYWLVIHVASLFNDKAKKWVAGRKDIFTYIKKTLQDKHINGNIIWVHCASLGEFEQGRPAIETIKKNNPQQKIVLTFFSPSGYEIRKDYKFADAVFYLPLDIKSNVNEFLAIIKPIKAIFIKYEFWLNYLNELKHKNIPTYLISATFRPNQHFFKWYGLIFFNALKNYTKIFLQDENSYQLLNQQGLTNIEIAGDTRFDRVLEISQIKNELPIIKKFCSSNKIIVAGSTWPKDEEFVIAAFKKLKSKYPNIKLIIAPHEVNETSVSAIEKLVGTNYSLYTNPKHLDRADVLIIDTIGMLSQIYRYGNATYIGGGFNDGIHNILEALAYNIPTAFGTNYKKFVEANETLELHISKVIYNENDLFIFFEKIISNKDYSEQLSSQIKKYMGSKTGATKKIVAELLSI